VILGQHQNAAQEINFPYIRKNRIRVARRVSGGGAVYHDHGNLNFCFISKYTHGEMLPLENFTRPVLAALAALGVPAEPGDRNGIVVAGRKISGSAQFTTVRSLISHGTLLFESRLDALQEALAPGTGRIESRAVRSIQSRVANLSEFLDKPISMQEFREHMVRHLFGTGGDVPVYRLGNREWNRVHHLADSVYRTWEWIFGRSPGFRIRRARRFPSGKADAVIDVREGTIRSVRFSGIFPWTFVAEELEKHLPGVRYDPDSIRRLLTASDLFRTVRDDERDEFIDFLHD
jgi:lipoate-protein ligase A